MKKGIIANDNDIRMATEPIKMHANKYSHGRVLILGASQEWRGAALMAAYAADNALAALRTGTGFVTIAATKKLIFAAGKLSPVFVVKELKGEVITDTKEIGAIRHDVIVVGPGLEKSNISAKFLEAVAKLEKKKGNMMIIDAAALGVLKGHERLIGKNMILTPHDGEFKALTGIDLKDGKLEERINAAKAFAKQHRCTLVLKGHETIVTDGKRIKIDVSKTPALATMGTGDVLCGIIASYAASHKEPFESAVAGVHVHSIIGDELFKKKGVHITAQDVIDAIPDVLKRFDVIK